MSLHKQVKDAFRYDSRKLSWYRDFTLGVTGGMSILFGAIFTQLYIRQANPFDLKIAIGFFVVVLFCVVLSPNRLVVLTGSFATVAALFLLRLPFTHDLRYLEIGIGMLLLIIIMAGISGGLEAYREQRRRRLR